MALTRFERDDSPLRLGEDGFLLDRQDWDESVAGRLASMIPIELTEKHWEIIRFMRDYYEKYRHLPNNRLFVKAVRTRLGEARGCSAYLNRLFPGSPVKWVCLVAGLPKPPGCL